MAETTSNESHELNQHESNKLMRERLAHAHWIMSYQTKYIPEQFEETQKTLKFIELVCKQLQEKIEAVEPPVKKEEPKAKGPFVIDATHIQPEANQ